MDWLSVSIARRLVAFVAGVMVLGLLPAQAAWAASQDIHSNGPLTDIWTGDDLTCQVAHTGSTGTTYQFYGGAPGSCGTFLSIDTPGGDPQSFGYGAAASTTYTPVSQSAVTGSGTADDPYRVTTVEAAGSTGLQVTQVDSYVAGNDYYQTDMTVTNTSSATASGRLYHAADCYLQGSDVGYGYVDASKNAVACAANANNSPRALIEEFAPLTGSAKYVEAGYSTVWSDVRSQTDLPSTCDCTIREDNGMGINWDFSLAPGASQTFSLLSNFSSSGVLADHTISATGDRSFTDTVPVHVSGTLASFTDSKPNTAPSEYSAAIDWGDGVTSQGTVSATDGGFSVSGDHTYTAIGSYTISVTISDVNGNANDATVTDSATANPSHSITATGGNSLSGTEPATVNGTLATFSDSKPGTDTSEYAATIDWGDDSSSSGTISANGGGFSVSGNHKYSSAGSYTISVTISDVNNDADSQTVTDSAAIAARHTITATGGNAFTGTAPATVNGTLATFSDSKAGTAPSEYSATIDWGDHTAASAGTITVSNGSFVVSGSHTYSSPGSYTIAVTISDVNGNANSPTVNDSATVSAPPVAPASGSPTPTSPGATTGSPTPTSSTAANLSGSANPGGLPTTAHWEYGLDPGQRGPGFTGNVYDQSTPSQPVGSDFSSHTLATSVSNLVPNALYHVRLVASNSAGTTVGPDRTFTTPKAGSPPPPVLGQ
ncbi:MAG: hypothetical protein JWM05_2292, partial [Acidimicrobiales bacterium]|nr:hypothetical protein [Acidimicrobiales bacterium]